MWRASLLAGGAVLAAACSSHRAPGAGDAADAAATTPMGFVAGEPGGAPGYRHAIERSAFHLGGGVVDELDADGAHHYRGSDGVLGVDGDGGAQSSWNAGSWCANASGPGGDAAKAAGRDFWVSRGVPADQIGSIFVSYSGSSSGTADGADGGVTSVLYAHPVANVVRTIHGMLVERSGASVEITSDGETCREEISWPPIPATTVAAADALRAMLASPSALAAYQAKLPAGFEDGAVVIRHTGLYATGTFESDAAYEASDGEQSRYFDADAKELGYLP